MIYHYLECDSCKGIYKTDSADKYDMFFDDLIRLKANAEVNGWFLKKEYAKKGKASCSVNLCPACKKIDTKTKKKTGDS